MSLNGPAAARLYDQHVDAVYSYAARRVGSADAVGVVEEVFEQALRKNAERPPHTASDLGWLLAMATAFLRRHSEAECRRLRAWVPVQRETSRAIPRVSDPLLSNDAEDPAVTMTAEVMAAVADLEPVERDVLFLVAWEGCSSALTATATGLPQNEIRPTLTRIRKSIRQTIAATATPPIIEPGVIQATPDAGLEPEPDPDPETEVEPKPEIEVEPEREREPEPEVDPDVTEPLDRGSDPLAAFELDTGTGTDTHGGPT